MPALPHIFLFDGVDVAHSDQHAVLRLHLGREIKNVRQLSRSQVPWWPPEACRGRCRWASFRGVDVGMRVDPDQADFLILAAIKLGDASHRARGNRMIAAQHQRNHAGFQRLYHQLGGFGAGGGNFFQIFGGDRPPSSVPQWRRKHCRHPRPRAPTLPVAPRARQRAPPKAPYPRRGAIARDRAERRSRESFWQRCWRKKRWEAS